MGYTQPGGCTKVLTFCRLEINFPIFFPAIFYWAERIKNGELGINRPTWCCSLFPIPTVKDSEGISRSFPITMSLYSTNPSNHLLSLVQWPAMLYRRLYRSERKKRSNAVKEEEEEKFLIKNPSILMWAWVGAPYLSAERGCTRRIDRCNSLALVDTAIGQQQLIHSNQRLLLFLHCAESAGIDISKSQRDQTNR